MVKEFLTPITNSDYYKTQMRTRFERSKKIIIRFTVQLEYVLETECVPIIRYDNAHGLVHTDKYYRSGEVKKTPIDIPLNKVIEYAQSDIKENWKRYLDEYLRS